MLKGKIAFVTGATRGIGWAIAKIFAENGATILLNGVSNTSLLEQRVEELHSTYGVEAEGFLFDVSDAAQVKNFYSAAVKKYKTLNVLVNNAGILQDSLLGMITPEVIETTYRVNVFSMIYNMQYASRLMERAGGGSIINMSSIVGRFGNEGQAVYAGSKAAIIGMTLSASKELAPKNIRVNAIAPGFIDTDMTKSIPKQKFNERLSGIKMKRIGTPTDIARTALYLASDLSEYVTGQIIGVDGAMLI